MENLNLPHYHCVMLLECGHVFYAKFVQRLRLDPEFDLFHEENPDQL